MLGRHIFTLIVSILFVGVSQASNLIDKMAGQYSRTVSVDSALNIEDEIVEAKEIQHTLRISPLKDSNLARVSFMIMSANGSQPSCSGDEVFAISRNGRSLFLGSDLGARGLSPEDSEGACNMTLTRDISGAVIIRSSQECQLEVCGAGNSFGQNDSVVRFVKSK